MGYLRRVINSEINKKHRKEDGREFIAKNGCKVLIGNDIKDQEFIDFCEIVFEESMSTFDRSEMGYYESEGKKDRYIFGSIGNDRKYRMNPKRYSALKFEIFKEEVLDNEEKYDKFKERDYNSAIELLKSYYNGCYTITIGSYDSTEYIEVLDESEMWNFICGIDNMMWNDYENYLLDAFEDKFKISKKYDEYILYSFRNNSVGIYVPLTFENIMNWSDMHEFLVSEIEHLEKFAEEEGDKYKY